MTKRTVLAWVDLETTGLDPNKGRILEYAIVFTDLYLEELSYIEGIIHQPVDEAVALMDDFCKEMHTKSGLLAELPGPQSTLGYEDYLRIAEIGIKRAFATVAELAGDNPSDVIFVIAGSTVAFDRAFLKKAMPEVASLLHYRQLDVSSYKVGFPEIFGTNTSDAHRAMPDIRASIEHHRKMREIVAIAMSQTVGFKAFVQPSFDEHDAC